MVQALAFFYLAVFVYLALILFRQKDKTLLDFLFLELLAITVFTFIWGYKIVLPWLMPITNHGIFSIMPLDDPVAVFMREASAYVLYAIIVCTVISIPFKLRSIIRLLGRPGLMWRIGIRMINKVSAENLYIILILLSLLVFPMFLLALAFYALFFEIDDFNNTALANA